MPLSKAGSSVQEDKGLLQLTDAQDYPTPNTELSHLPLAFLESYPFPAFILHVPIPLHHGSTDGYQHSTSINSPNTPSHTSGAWLGSSGLLQPVWVNQRFTALNSKRTLLDLLSMRDLEMFTDWISGVLEREASNKADSSKVTPGIVDTPFAFGSPLSIPLQSPQYGTIQMNMTQTSYQTQPPNPTSSFLIIQCIPAQTLIPTQSLANPADGVNDAAPLQNDLDNVDASSDSESAMDMDQPVSRSPIDHIGSDPAHPKHVSVEYLLETKDWSKTSLGSRNQWPESLRTMLSLVMALPLQATLWWGPDLLLLYNQKYAKMLRGKHPHAFGVAGAINYAEVWSTLGPVAKGVIRGKPESREDDFFLFETLDPDTPLIECYHSWYWIPIFDTDFRKDCDINDPKKFLGLLNFTTETTDRVIAARRVQTVREISDNLSAARTMGEYDTAILSALGTKEIARDIPFALVYHVSRDESEYGKTRANITGDDLGSATNSVADTIHLVARLGGSLGVPANHPCAPQEVVLEIDRPDDSVNSAEALRNKAKPTTTVLPHLDANQDKMTQWPLKEVIQGRRAVLVEDIAPLIQGFEPRGWDVLPTKAILLPVCNDMSSEIPDGVLILGLNRRRMYNQAYSEWHHQIRLSAYNGLLQVRSVEAEIQRHQEIQMMDEIKTNWISNVSHELRLPLTLIHGPVEDLLTECRGNTRARSLLSIAKRNVGRLRRLVDQLMDFSRIEGGHFAIACRPTPIGGFTADLANLFRNAIERTNLTYTVDCEDDNGRYCYVDPDMYEKVILNLIGNAFKYCHEGFVNVSLKYGHDQVVVQVSDSGVGIPRQEMHRVGERFFRVESHSRSHEGTGIGLSLTKELIKLMGGSLELESLVATENAEGKHGSVFTVTLPLGTDHLPARAIAVPDSYDYANRNRTLAEGIVEEAMRWDRDNDSNETTSEGGSSHRPSITTERSGTTLDPHVIFFDDDDVVLIVDDSKDLRTYLRSILAPHVSNVVEANNGEDGFAKAKQHKPALIISDIQMPKMDGYELLHMVKADEELRWTPVILLTARTDETERVEGLLTGAEDYLTKPFQSRELVARASLQVQLGKRRKILEESFANRLEEVEKRREEADMERKRQELLIDVTSHELRNPTSAIIQSSQMVSEDLALLRETVQRAVREGKTILATTDLINQLSSSEELCHNINSCAQNQSRIADDVLALARINLDMMQFHYQPTHIRKRARDVVAPFRVEAKTRGIELELDLDDKSLELVPYVMTDPFRLGQVLVNLVSNAMRYSGDGRVVVRFALRPGPPVDDTCLPPPTSFDSQVEDGDDCYLYIAVSDSGPGLAKEDVQLLFKRFSQATRHANKAFGGSGLGLWISKQISVQMGGRIEVDSEIDKGCTFRFFVKVKAAMHFQAEQERIMDAPVAPTPSKPPMPLARSRVLVVEDNLINRNLLVKQLEKRGATVEALEHGQAAVDRLRQVCGTGSVSVREQDQPFDVVLMDVEMPVMDGLTAIRVIREEESQGKLKRSYVTALTGNARQRQIDEALSNGMDAVVIKPYKIDEIVKQIQERMNVT